MLIDGINRFFNPYPLDTGYTEHVANSSVESLSDTSWQSPNVFRALEKEELDLAKNIPFLQKSVEQYESLYKNLQQLDLALKNRKSLGDALDDFSDEVITHEEIFEPYLIFLQYQEHGVWKAAPSLTFVTDKTNLHKWFCAQGNNPNHYTHPLNRFNIFNPPPYEGHKTRHCLVAYKDMTTCQELVETTARIREAVCQYKAQQQQKSGNDKQGIKVTQNTHSNGSWGRLWNFFQFPCLLKSTSPTVEYDEYKERVLEV